jgi:hypothetical protein
MTYVRTTIQSLGTKGLISQAVSPKCSENKKPPVSERLLPYSFIVAIWRGWMSQEERNYFSWECKDLESNQDSWGLDRQTEKPRLITVAFVFLAS